MGFFNKLFGQNGYQQNPENHQNDFKLTKQVDILDENSFWNIIQNSLERSDDQYEQLQIIKEELAKLPPEEIIRFQLQMDKLIIESYTSLLWCAAYVINGGCSDDGFDYFRYWLISRGKNTYYKAMENPDYLVNETVSGDIFFEMEELAYLAPDVFQYKTTKDLYEFMEMNDQFIPPLSPYPEMTFDWQEDNPESMKKLCPNLFEKYWNNWNSDY